MGGDAGPKPDKLQRAVVRPRNSHRVAPPTGLSAWLGLLHVDGRCCVEGWMDCRSGRRDGRPCVEFTWEGNGESDPASGRGWATSEEDGSLHGHIDFHLGDDSGFRAVRAENVPKPEAKTGGTATRAGGEKEGPPDGRRSRAPAAACLFGQCRSVDCLVMSGALSWAGCGDWTGLPLDGIIRRCEREAWCQDGEARRVAGGVLRECARHGRGAGGRHASGSWRGDS